MPLRAGHGCTGLPGRMEWLVAHQCSHQEQPEKLDKVWKSTPWKQLRAIKFREAKGRRDPPSWRAASLCSFLYLRDTAQFQAQAGAREPWHGFRWRLGVQTQSWLSPRDIFQILRAKYINLNKKPLKAQ